MSLIRLNITTDNIDTVMILYDQLRLERNTVESDEDSALWTALTDLGAPNGNLNYVQLQHGQTQYLAYDTMGDPDYWYRSYYFNSTTSGMSGPSEAVRGESPDLFYNPLFPPETDLSTEERMVVDRIRLLIGDPIDLSREYGDDAASSIHPDGKTYELDEKGWPVSIYMNGKSYNDSTNPTINGYRYLMFNEFIDTTMIVCSGTRTVEYGVDIWTYTFRWSDRQILEAYNNCPPPPGLTTATANPEAYMLYTATTLIGSENWHDAIEDGADISDEGSKYSPKSGFEFRADLLDNLNKKLDDTVKSLILGGITGVLLD